MSEYSPDWETRQWQYITKLEKENAKLKEEKSVLMNCGTVIYAKLLEELNDELKEDIIELKGANAAHINVDQERIVDALEEENQELKDNAEIAFTMGTAERNGRELSLELENAELKEVVKTDNSEVNLNALKRIEQLERQLKTAKADMKKIDEQSGRVFKANGLLKAEMRICPYCKGGE